MDKLAATGDSIVLQPVGFLWQAWDGKLPLRGSNIITSEGKSAILETDVMTAALQGMGKMYVSPAFPTPGTVLSLQLTVIPASLSLSVSIMGQKVVTAMTMGTYTATVVPAMNPQGIPDPLVTKVGQWTVETTSQSAFRSGVPAPLPDPQDGDGSGGGDSTENDGEPHWVAVTIEDQDGNPLANQLATFLLPTGERIARKLGDSGAARVDGIEGEGEGENKGKAVVSVLFDPSLAPVAPPDDGHIAVNVVDDAGIPFAGREVVLTLPDGTQLRRTLNELGHTRFVGIPRKAACTLEIVPALVLLEFELVDEDGAPLAEMPFKVVDSTGKEYTGVLDDKGAASIEVFEGECNVTVDFDAVSNASEKTGAPLAAEAGQTGERPNSSSGDALDLSSRTDTPLGAAIVPDPPPFEIIEIGDTHFRTNSAVFLPNAIGDALPNETAFSPGITLLERAIRFLQLSNRKLLLAGHTDTVGNDQTNITLSELRADCVKAILLGNRELFSQVADAPHITDKTKKDSTLRDDKLQFCDWVAAEFNVKCGRKQNGFDPIRTFKALQQAHNDFGFSSGAPLDVDGDWGPLTWKAAFDFYELRLADRLLLSRAGLNALRGNLGLAQRLLGGENQRVGCGEFQPVEGPSRDNLASPTNRRVELLFFEPGAPVNAPCLSGPCAKQNCPLFRPQAETRGQIATARWSEPLTIAGHSETREVEVEFAGIAAGGAVEFSIFRVTDQGDEPTLIGRAEDVIVERGKAKGSFNELHEDVTSSLPARDVLRYSYFFVAKGSNFEITSARLHAELDNVIFP